MRGGGFLSSLAIAGAKRLGPAIAKQAASKAAEGLVSMGPGLIRHISQLKNKRELRR
jgi:hypothetical protein